jgi:hypothetical protein
MGRFLSIVLPQEDRSGSAAVEMFHGLNIVCPSQETADQVELKWNHIRLSEVSGRVAMWSKFELVEVVLW